MSITATEFKKNIGKYLEISAKEDVYISKNGKIVAKLTNPNKSRVEMAKSLAGVIPADISLEDARTERTSKL